MDKPISLSVKEFREAIFNTINNSNLPPWYIADFLELVSIQARKQSDETTLKMSEMYARSLAEQAENDGGNE